MAKIEDRKKIMTDLWIIGITTFIALGTAVFAMQNGLNSFAHDERFPIVLRVLVIGFYPVCPLRSGNFDCMYFEKTEFSRVRPKYKESYSSIAFCLLCCVPELIFYAYRGYLTSWLPFQSVNTTYEVLRSPFPSNVIAYLITTLCWGIFEGFNYVVIRDKISAAYPSTNRFFDWGALVSAVMCILVHGAVGVTPEALDYYGITYGKKVVYTKRKEYKLPECCILNNDGFVLWYKESYYEVRDIAPKKTVSFLEVIC